jgi:2-keto-4-pentenoate hydratase/2-oxohepta-3-ene-1,7-dioic acid hydratase in catechol pathway
MQLVTYRRAEGDGRAGTQRRIGRLEGDVIVDLSAIAPDMLSLLEAGREALERARRTAGQKVALGEVQLAAPVPRPPKILAVGLNYADHVAEMGRETPKLPMIFNKQATAATGPRDPIHLPRVSRLLDYEGELGVVIGRRCRHVPKERANEVVAGYVVVDDVSVRDWQMRVPTMTMGKSFDTHCPFGPAIVTPDEVGDPHVLALTTRVNGELRQSTNTRNLIFDCFDLIEHLSTAFTLEPGDLISTGTCGGVAAAFEPPKWLVAGDVVRVEIEKVGALENRVIAEPDDTARI